MKRAFVLAVACLVLSSVAATSQTRGRSSQKRPGASTTFAEKQQAEMRAGREQIAGQIKTLTQFLYLFGGISKGIETAELVNRNHEESFLRMTPERIEENKTKLKDSIKNVRVGLDKLESSFRLNPVLQAYHANVAGVAGLARSAETQAAANLFDQAGRSLIAAVNKLTDALVMLR